MGVLEALENEHLDHLARSNETLREAQQVSREAWKRLGNPTHRSAAAEETLDMDDLISGPQDASVADHAVAGTRVADYADHARDGSIISGSKDVGRMRPHSALPDCGSTDRVVVGGAISLLRQRNRYSMSASNLQDTEQSLQVTASREIA